jgi:IPT/TIG domain/SMP-30/Gluconolactonase/LRE-like region
MPRPTISSVTPLRAVEGGRVTLRGSGFPVDAIPEITVGGQRALVAFASSSRIVVTMPAEVEPGPTPIRIEDLPGATAYISVGGHWATGLHQVDNPVFDAEGNLFVTYSGSRGQESPVSIFRVTRAGSREPFVSGIVNATSMAIGPDRQLYVSSRFEGAVYRVTSDGKHELVASELGVACGLAFDREGGLYVGDRSGTIFRVRDNRAEPFATLPASVAAFHLAISPEGELFASGPTLSTYDHVYRIGPDGKVRSVLATFGRPQGLAFSPSEGTLHVVDALAGRSGLYRLKDLDGEPELLVAGCGFIGVAFGPSGELAVASNDTAYRFD